MKAVDCECGGKSYVGRGSGGFVQTSSLVLCMRCGLQQNSGVGDVDEEPAIIRWNAIQKKLRMAAAGVTPEDMVRDSADVATMGGTDR